MSSNPYKDVKWCVHVMGPDEIFAANDFKEAADRANEINQLWDRDYIQAKMDEYCPRVWAVVELWISPATGNTCNKGHQENRDKHNWEW